MTKPRQGFSVVPFGRGWLLGFTLTATVTVALAGCSGGNGSSLVGKVAVAVCATTQHVCPCTTGMYCLANSAGCLVAPEATCPATADLVCKVNEKVCPCFYGGYCLQNAGTCEASNAGCPVPTE